MTLLEKYWNIVFSYGRDIYKINKDVDPIEYWNKIKPLFKKFDEKMDQLGEEDTNEEPTDVESEFEEKYTEEYAFIDENTPGEITTDIDEEERDEILKEPEITEMEFEWNNEMIQKLKNKKILEISTGKVTFTKIMDIAFTLGGLFKENNLDDIHTFLKDGTIDLISKNILSKTDVEDIDIQTQNFINNEKSGGRKYYVKYY